MNWPRILLLVITCTPTAWCQIQSGTVIWVDFSGDEITIAADSRTTKVDATTGQVTGHNDSQCKISVFGDKFVFALSGAEANHAEKWDAHSIALQAWRDETPHHNSASGLVSAVAESWTTKMKSLFTPATVRVVRNHMKPGDDPLLGVAFFAATDTSGTLAVHEVEMEFDLKQFDSTGTVSITPYPSDLPENRAKPAGMAEIVDEFYNGKSTRAKEYMQWFKSRVVDLPSSQRQAELASKLIELSILLHPRNDELGFPVDVVQLRRKSGVFTRWLKPTCRPSE